MFKLQNNIVTIAPEELAVPEMRAIWDRDKSKDKGLAYKELSYIYFLCNFKSPYQSYPENKREQQVIHDFIRDDSWHPDEKITLAIEKYNEMQETPSMRLLRSARKTVDEISRDLQEMDDKSKTYTLANLGKIIESIDKLEEKVKKEITTESRVRGGGEAKTRER